MWWMGPKNRHCESEVGVLPVSHGKENAYPLPEVPVAPVASRAEFDRWHREEMNRQEAAAREEAERQAAELRRQHEAEMQRKHEEREHQLRLEEQQARAEAEEAAHRAHEAALRREQEEQNQASQRAAQLAERAAELQQQESTRNDQLKLNAFLQQHNYTGVNTKRSTKWKSKYALHTAVKNKDEDMVRILLANGAKASVADSYGVQPIQLAQQMNTDGSLTPTVRMLRDALFKK